MVVTFPQETKNKDSSFDPNMNQMNLNTEITV